VEPLNTNKQGLYDEFMREMGIKNRAYRTIDTIEQSLNKCQVSLDKSLEDLTWDELLGYHNILLDLIPLLVIFYVICHF